MKTVLITGASRGIGKAIAEKFAKNGYNTVINYNKSDSAAKTLTEGLSACGFSVCSIKADVSVKEEAAALVKKAEDKFGGIDVIINNAGIANFSLAHLVSDEDFNRVMGVNFNGAHYIIKAALPKMISNKKGVIVNVSSIWGKVGASCEAVYSASKAALIGYTKALSKELGLSGIRVNAVCPGVIETDMNKNLSEADLQVLKDGISLNRLGQAEEVAEVVYFLSSDNASYVTGQIINVDGGFIE